MLHIPLFMHTRCYDVTMISVREREQKYAVEESALLLCVEESRSPQPQKASPAFR